MYFSEYQCYTSPSPPKNYSSQAVIFYPGSSFPFVQIIISLEILQNLTC
ncbi:hypothetical protein CLV24_105114 [Pontibacter ummariensis]|nr:hypothetical protein CLV24_105114 [Pontibacter ummariensis]